MANSAYWFKHDTNAKDDYKVMLLMDQLGLEGYGIFWVLIEVLREQAGYVYPVNMLPILAKRYGSSTEKFKTVVFNYGLFEVFDDTDFASHALLKRMGEYDKYCEQRRIAGSKGGLQKQAHAKHMLSTKVPHAKHESSKVVASGVEWSGVECNGEEKNEEIVKRKAFTVPNKNETASFFCENGSTNEEAGKFWYHYDANGWMAGRVKMKNWQSAAKKWISNSKTIYSNESGKQQDGTLTKADHAALAYKLAGGGSMGI